MLSNPMIVTLRGVSSNEQSIVLYLIFYQLFILNNP